VASISPEPPDRNIIPVTAGNTDLDSVLTVIHATCAGSTLVLHSNPGVTMFGFNNKPSKRTPYNNNLDITAANTFSDTSAHFSMS